MGSDINARREPYRKRSGKCHGVVVVVVGLFVCLFFVFVLFWFFVLFCFVFFLFFLVGCMLDVFATTQ